AADAGSLASGFPVRLPDLRGLLWLFSHRARSRATFRIQPASQFQLTLYLDILFRVLDSMAHLTLEFAPDLSLHSALGNRAWPCANLPEPDRRDDARWHLAWRRPRLCALGHAARAPACGRTPLPQIFREIGRGHSACSHWRRVLLRHDTLDFLQAAEF